MRQNRPTTLAGNAQTLQGDAGEPDQTTPCGLYRNHPSGTAMTTVVIIVGIMVLMVFSVMIGTAMDTEAQRRQWKRVAAQRRRLADERRPPSGLCGECPYRNFEE